jgi:hypothetical protein
LLLFVGPDHFSREVSSNGFCEGSAHPWSYVQLSTLSYDAGTAAESQNIDTVLGAGPTDAWKKAADKAHGGAKKREKACLADARPEEWALVRQKGQWSLRGELNYAAESCRGKHEYFTVDTALPAKFTGPDALPQPWAKLSSETKELTDVLSSPSGKLTLVVTTNAIELRSQGKLIGRLDEAKAAVVMSQWALGKNAARWKAEVTKIFTDEQASAQSF